MTPTLRFTTGSMAGRAFPLAEGETRVGRDPSVELPIPEADQRFVSRIHAVLIRDGDRVVLEDRDSTNGTLVNGEAVRRVALAHGDEVRFGRQGPVARFEGAVREAFRTELAGSGAGDDVSTRLAGAGEALPWPRPGADASGSSDGARAVPPGSSVPPPNFQSPRQPPHSPPPVPAGTAPSSPGERPSQLVRRLVDEALAREGPRRKGRPVLLALGVVALVGMAALGSRWMAPAAGSEDTFRALAEDYTERVVLVEVGVQVGEQYIKLSNGSGFVADPAGLIVTNKHVVRGELYTSSMACIAESFRRRRLSFADARVISVWQGGTPFRQNPTQSAGDQGLGFSSSLGTLELAASAPDNLQPARTVGCSDFFGGANFNLSWRGHATDNNDLAVLRVTDSLPAIPLADDVPEADAPVMVFGFPNGVTPLETNEAEPLRRTGRVLRTQETIQIDAVVLHGNSGGPLIDARGDVVGITTRGPAETLNMAIRVDHARRLLDRVRQGADG